MHGNNRAIHQRYLRESDRKAIEQVRQPRSEVLGYIWRPRRRAFNVAGMEDVDGNASALGGDVSEEVHRVSLFLDIKVKVFVCTFPREGESIRPEPEDTRCPSGVSYKPRSS